MNNKFSLHFIIYLILASLIVFFDQYSKSTVANSLAYGVPYRIFSWFNLMWVNNTGAAFSFLADADGWQRWFLSGISIVASIGLFIWLLLTPYKQWLLSLALACILGGAAGNMIDRVMLGYVIDFISVHYNNRYFFATFNIADSAISVGAALLILDMLLGRKQRNSKKTKWRDIAD